MSRRGFEDWRFTGDPAPLARDNIIIFEGCRLQIYSRHHIKRRIGGALPANASFGMTTTKMSKNTFLWNATDFCYPQSGCIEKLNSLSSQLESNMPTIQCISYGIRLKMSHLLSMANLFLQICEQPTVKTGTDKLSTEKYFLMHLEMNSLTPIVSDPVN